MKMLFLLFLSCIQKEKNKDLSSAKPKIFKRKKLEIYPRENYPASPKLIDLQAPSRRLDLKRI